MQEKGIPHRKARFCRVSGGFYSLDPFTMCFLGGLHEWVLLERCGRCPTIRSRGTIIDISGRIVAPWSSFNVQIRYSSQIYMVDSNSFNNWASFDYSSPCIYPLTDIIDLWTYLTAQGKDRAQVMSLRQQQQGYQTRRLS